MRWLWFVGSLICFAIVFKTASMGLAVLALLGALGFLLVGVVVLASSRIESRSQDASVLLGPDELRRMREIDARRRADSKSGDGGATFAAGGTATAPAHAPAARNKHHDLDSNDDGGSGSSDGGSDGGGGGD